MDANSVIHIGEDLNINRILYDMYMTNEEFLEFRKTKLAKYSNEELQEFVNRHLLNVPKFDTTELQKVFADRTIY